MHLSQHHFQSQSRYFEGLLGFALSQLYFRPYGLAGYELDAEALLNGTVVLRHARGLMPDGLPFECPEDPLPAPLAIRERFSPTAESHLVFQAVPVERPNRANCALEPGQGAGELRFSAQKTPVADEVTGEAGSPVALARKNLRLVLDVDRTDELVALPLARVRRDGAGHFAYDPDFIPPSLRIGASPALMGLLRRLVELLGAKSDSLEQERRAAGADYASREIAGFWLAHAIHSALAPLQYHLQTRGGHPEALFAELSQLAGALCTFSMNAHPRDLPAYDHDHLEESFGALERHIRANLDVVMPTNAITFPLLPAEPAFFVAAVTDPRTLRGDAAWYLAVRSPMSPAELMARVPALVKVCSAKHIERLVREAFPGLSLTHATTLPDAIAPRAGTQYFAIHPAGPCWTSIVESAQVGVYAPAAIPDPSLELIAVLER
jgi:type VI secretion system protein ImpJ